MRHPIYVVLLVICAVFSFAVVFSRHESFRPVKDSASQSHVMSYHVIQSEVRVCGLSLVGQNVDTERQICRPLLRGDANEPHNSMLPPRTPMSVDDYIQLASTDCDCFRSRRGYFTAADTTPEERAFPIGFSLLTYENLEQTERLLRLVYRPHNLYCIHVDRKSDPEMHRGIEALAACLPNVMVARPTINVTWGEISVLQAELLCMGHLLAHSGVHWKYFINLVARDMPLRTNEELVKILEAYDGANDIQGIRKG